MSEFRNRRSTVAQRTLPTNLEIAACSTHGNASSSRDPNWVASEGAEAKPPEPLQLQTTSTQIRTFTNLIRTALFSILRNLAARDFEAALENIDDLTDANGDTWTAPKLERLMTQYRQDHERILLDNEARNLRHTYVKPSEDKTTWLIQQTIVDPEAHNDWTLDLQIDLQRSRELGRPHLQLFRLGMIGR